MDKIMKMVDIDNDGKITSNDVQNFTTLNKDKNQARLAWVSMLAMVVCTVALFLPWIPNERIHILENVLDIFYLAHASVVGFYFGAQAYMSKRT